MKPISDAVGAVTKTHRETQELKHISPDSDRTENRTYRFDFGSDEKIYSVSFDGHLAQSTIQGILENLHSQLYQNCSRSIQTYLEQYHLEYTHFKTSEYLLKHEEIMEQAEYLLKACSPEMITKHIGNTANYYAIMDYQRQLHDNYCEGCYYAISRILNGESCSCHIVGQTFICDMRNGKQHGYFAIRTGDCRYLHDLDIKTDNFIFPAFGCIDMLSVLSNINTICTAKEAEKIAVK